MQDTSCEREDMEYRMKVLYILTELIKYRATCIGYTTTEQKPKACRTEASVHIPNRKYDSPAHSDIADHTEDLIFL